MSRGTNTVGTLFLIVGAAIMVGAVFIMASAKSTNLAGAVTLGIGALIAILGALFIEPDATKTALGSLSAQVGPYIPGGRRASDPVERPHDG